ncbi:hypothetical protein DSL72_002082 [Monilinia vaccinii-corymbosi]|uniref:G-protein coupled receptors family 1 profile domain-containing protein n=1 Tax=Monilinia vaccinii-corymbosi TaxID=61207 RepID=A0A8A3PBL4_9HELO|nr:hypothetical protein DSL72_002082 [Monilinia vaccinii-corymbosi]
MSLTHAQSVAIDATERTAAAISIIGNLFIILTFFYCASFDKPINRLIFFASWGNIGSSISCLVTNLGAASLEDRHKFDESPICQVQGFLVQMFRGVDCYWAFFMAINVYLVFFRGITIILAFIVYYMAAKVIWSKREHLKGFLNPLNETPFASTITTEIEITYEERSIVKDASDQGICENTISSDQYAVEIQAMPQEHHESQVYHVRRMRSLTREAAQSETNPEAWLYARVAILFFLAMIITWVPASVNRIWQMANPKAINFPLNYIESLVLSLQGVWNVIVYIITSQTACRRLAYRTFSGSSRKKARLPSGSPERYRSGGKQRLESVSSK